MKNSTISILIPTNNRPNRFYRALQSAVSQKYKDREIICSNDSGSWGKYVDKLIYDTGVQYILKAPEGPSANYKTLLEAAKGDYVIFLDDDDYFIHDKVLDKYMKKLSNSGAIPGLHPACVGNHFMPGHTNKLKTYWRWSAIDFLTNVFIDTNDFQLSQVLFARWAIIDYDFETLKDLPENDVAMFQWALCHGGSVPFVDSFTYVLGISNDNMTWGKNVKYHVEWLDMIERRMKKAYIPEEKIHRWRKAMEKNHEFYPARTHT